VIYPTLTIRRADLVCLGARAEWLAVFATAQPSPCDEPPRPNAERRDDGAKNAS
jgi:hypothetical protein